MRLGISRIQPLTFKYDLTKTFETTACRENSATGRGFFRRLFVLRDRRPLSLSRFRKLLLSHARRHHGVYSDCFSHIKTYELLLCVAEIQKVRQIFAMALITLP